MSTFNGYVKEIPYIAVDYFDYKREPFPKIFFLTHCHTDHTKGLLDKEFKKKILERNAFIYATAITIAVLKSDYYTIPYISSQLKEIEVNKCTIISYKDDCSDTEQYLQVTAIDAKHCPGSVMFFFEGEQNVLCTGDFRIDPLELDKFQVFRTTLGQIKNIDVIYLDTTFFSKDYPHFPSHKETEDALLAVVEKWLNYSPDHMIYLESPAKYSIEYLYIALAQNLKQKIHIGEDKKLYKDIPELDGIVSIKSDECRIHSGYKPENECCNIWKQKSYLIINLTAWKWINYTSNGNPVHRVEKNRVDICLSFHPSYTETVTFLKYFKPKRVELCVVPEGKREQREKLVEDILKEIQKERST